MKKLIEKMVIENSQDTLASFRAKVDEVDSGRSGQWTVDQVDQVDEVDQVDKRHYTL